jgi:hypothetical protein
MQAQHLYVVAFLNYHDLDTAKKRETLASATSLYNKYQHKCGNVALIEVAPAMAGIKCLKATSDGLPVPQSFKSQLSGCVTPSNAPSSSGSSAKQYKTSIGVYFVFHAEDEGQSIDPRDFVRFLQSVVQPEKLKEIQKISLIACNVAAQVSFGSPDTKQQGKNFDSVMDGRSPNHYSVSTMFGLMAALRAAGVTPAICGYDTPVFLGQGPLDSEGNAKRNKDQLMYPIQKYQNQKWVKAEGGVEDGRKLVLKHTGVDTSGKTTLVPISDMAEVNNQYRLAHKRVLRIDNSGNIAFGLSGWSDKG